MRSTITRRRVVGAVTAAALVVLTYGGAVAVNASNDHLPKDHTSRDHPANHVRP